MIDVNPFDMELVCYASVSISAVMFMIYLANTLPQGIITIRLPKPLCGVIEC